MAALTLSFTGGMPEPGALPPTMTTFQLVMQIMKMTFSLSLVQIAQFSLGITMVAVAGTIGVRELGGTSLGYTIISSTAFAFGAGISGALETLLSHEYGMNPNSKMYGVYTQRMFLLLLIVYLLLTPAILFTDRLLIAIGQQAEVVCFTGEFCRFAVWGCFFCTMLEMIRRYFACQGMGTSLSVGLILAAALFPPILIGCVKLMGYTGIGVGWTLLMMLTCGGLVLYLIVTKKYTNTWSGWSDAAFHDWGHITRLAIPSMCMMLSEWVALEVNTICAGFGTKEELAAFGVSTQVSGMCWSIASGTYMAASVMVGTAIGEGRPLLARRAACFCLIISLVISLVNVTVIVSTQNYFLLLFTHDEQVIAIIKSMIKYMVVYHIFDVFQSCMMGVLRGCGMQKQGAIVIFIIYSFLGVPLGIVLFFFSDLGIQALWLGPTVGVTLVGFPIYLYIYMYYIKWELLKPQTDGSGAHVVVVTPHQNAE
ncbi:putative membrane transporter protein [Trypanosoma vivax]|uniref:Putative membrane transporter protein n=1 Tax=Trypanosoma vivax (strain Y486) TaxID=1055687 RepID=G0TVK8_TRYVY|nr:putative membrane transporter protein [Trypanosoma vivax]CCC47974.1 putative membrane transporter protein [Trypanosoma vivax Y486]